MENEKNRYDDIDYGWREDESTVSQQNTSRWAEFDDDPAPVNRAKQKKNKKSGGFLKGLGIAVLALLLLFNTGTGVFLLSQHFSEEQAVAQNDTAAEMIPSDNITPATNDGTELSVAEVNQKVSPAVVLITARGMVGGGQGTGFIISDDGYIVTNAHVVADFNEITVTLNDEAKTEYPATVVGADATTDIAVLQIRAKDLPTAEIGTSADLQVGQDVVVIGNPLGEEFSGSVTTGIISALDRQVEFDRKQ